MLEGPHRLCPGQIEGGFQASQVVLVYPFTLALVRCRCCPSSLYTFPLAGARLGIASEGFPDFEQFCSWGFPQGTQWLQSNASISFATPA